MQKISPFLWFDNEAEPAMNFYVSVFKDAKALGVTRYGDAGPGPKGEVMLTSFELQGQKFTALNGRSGFTFNKSISFAVECEDQAEVDRLWAALTEGGKEVQCGWLEDKFGVSWQIIPKGFVELVTDPDPAKSARAMKAMMQMVKLDIDKLRAAHAG